MAQDEPGIQKAVLKKQNKPALWLLQCQALLSAANKGSQHHQDASNPRCLKS